MSSLFSSRDCGKRLKLRAFMTAIIAITCGWTAARSLKAQTSVTGGKPIVVRYDFERPSASLIDGRTRLTMPDTSLFVAPGRPVVPFRTARILLPPAGGNEEIEVTGSRENKLPGRYDLELGRAPQPTRSVQAETDLGSSVGYNPNEPFPGRLYELASIQTLRGYRIAILRLYPVEYVPATGQLSYYQSLTVTISLSSVSGTAAKAPGTKMFRDRPSDRATAAGVVDNPEMLKAYPITEGKLLEQPVIQAAESESSSDARLNSCQYLIITKNSYSPEFEPLLDWKMQKGLTGKIATVEEIGEQYEGKDLQEKIRNFITERYRDDGTEYVLLGGDVEIIPHRGAYGEVGGYTDDRIPCDLYYGCLDGSWDNDGDGIYGEANDGEEGGEIDLIAEVYVGRAPVSSATQAESFVTKTLQYEMQRTPNLSHALWVGEGLDSKTWGSDSKEELVILLPETFELIRLYEKQGTYSTSKVIAELNGSPHIVNHLGHSTETSALGLSKSNVDNLTNEFPFFLYSQGCDAGAFDFEDAIMEHFVKNEKGAFAVVANSRYGWYSPESTLGTSQTFDRSFLRAVFNKGIRNLGKALQDSKEANVGDVLQTGASRWCYFELNLLGDPETPLFTATSQGLVRLDQGKYSPRTPIKLEVQDIDLNVDPLVTEVAMVKLESPGDLEMVFAMETTSNSGVFAAEIPLSTGAPAWDGIVQVQHGDVVTAVYEDADDGTGFPQTVSVTVLIDDLAPSISDVKVTDVRDTWGVIEWRSDEPATARVDVGVSPPFTSSSQSDLVTKAHRVVVSGLEKETVYRFYVVATDTVGNETIDDNNGEYYSFKTKHQVLMFSDDVEDGSPSAAGEWAYQVISGNVSDWQITTDDFRSQTACWHTDDYPYPSANVLDTPSIDLRGMTSAQLSFWHRMLSETDWDGGFVQIQMEGMEEWASLTQEEMTEGTPFVILSTGNPSGPVPGWSGDIPWERVTFDISGFVGNRVRVRFRMESDDNTHVGEGDGWYIDDITVLRAMGTVNLDKSFYRIEDMVSITVLDAASNTDPGLAEIIWVEAKTSAESLPEIVALTETETDSGIFVGGIETSKAKKEEDGKLGLEDNGTITVSYQDAEPATAISDIRSADIHSVESTQVGDSLAIIQWETDEASLGVVYYGMNASDLTGVVSETRPDTSHRLILTELQPRTVHYFKVECVDRAGNVSVDDNEGELYSFLTLGFAQAGVISEDTVWSYVEGHPYVISGSVYVGTGREDRPVTLTIEPGVVVQFKTDKRDLFVRGGIVARGVAFEFDLASGRAAHIVLEESATGVIENSVISVLGSSEELSGGIECYSSKIQFANNIIRNAYYGFHCLSSSPTISGNSFIICNYGVFCHAAPGSYSSPEITDNSFIGCTYPIYCEPRGYPVVGRNTFAGNVYDGLVHSAISGDTLWPGYDCPQLIIGDLTVAEGRILRIGRGARIRFVEPGADLLVSGDLQAEGATIEFAVPPDPPTVLAFTYSGSGSIRDCRIVGESPDGTPTGGIKCQSSSVILAGNVITNTYYGVFCEKLTAPLITNNTIVECEFGVYGPDALPTLMNSILWNNGDDLVGCPGMYLNTTDGDAGEGNISADPLFRDAGNGDFRLLAGSPCIDSGTSLMAPLLDFEGYVRWEDPSSSNAGAGTYPYFDMGAHEHVLDTDRDGIPDDWEAQNGFNPEDPSDGDSDADLDGTSNRQEHIEGTDPYDPSSRLRITSLLPVEDGNGALKLEWRGVSGRSYRVRWADDISPPRGRRGPSSRPGNEGFCDLTIWGVCSDVIQGAGNVVTLIDDGSSTGKAPLYNYYGQRFYAVEVW